MFNMVKEMNRIASHLRYSYRQALLAQSKSRFFRDTQVDERVKTTHRQLAILVPMIRSLESFEQKPPHKSSDKYREWAKTYMKQYSALEKEVRANVHFSFGYEPDARYPVLATFNFPVLKEVDGRFQIVEGPTLLEIHEHELSQQKEKKKKVSYARRKLVKSLTPEQKKIIRELADLNGGYAVQISIRDFSE